MAKRRIAGAPSACTVLDALETSWVAEACTLSLRENRAVRLDEVRVVLTVERG